MSPPGHPLHRRGSSVFAALVLAPVLLVSCGEKRVQEPVATRERLARGEFNVAVIVLDACRADKMGFLGFERPTTPELDALSRDPDSVIFSRYYVQGSWTKPSTASLFTGLNVHQHGVRTGHDPKDQDGDGAPQTYRTDILQESHLTLAERMQTLGYRTFGVVKGENLSPQYGYGQGFQEYFTHDADRSDAARVERFLALATKSPGRFLGYLHLTACHNPWEETERDAEYMKQFQFPYDEPARRLAGVDFTGQQVRKAIRRGKLDLLPEDVRFLNLVYEAALRHTDRTLVRPLLDGLRNAGLYDDTLLIVTADHGEELFDHGGYAHGHAVWQELLHVPMLVKFPRGRRPEALGRNVTHLARAIDVLPSVLDFAGATVRGGLPGAPLFRGQYGDVSISEGRGTWSMTADDYKLIVAGGETMLFHLASDPAEKTDLAKKQPQRVQEMKTRLEAMLASGASAAPGIDVKLTPEGEANLRALGYIR